MSSKDQSVPGSSKTFAAAVAAASTSSTSPASVTNATSVIIGVTVSVGSVVLLVVAIRIWRCTRPPKAPLPPKGPLAHDRLRHMAAEFTQSELPASVPIRAQGVLSAGNTPNSPYNNCYRQSCSRIDVVSIPPSSSSMVSSQAHLVPPESDENAEIRRGRRPSLGSPSSAVRHHGYRSRTISNTGSVRSTRSRQSSQGTVRGPPHHRHVNIVLPQPLAPGLYNINNTLQHPHAHHPPDNSSERRSVSRDRGVLSGISLNPHLIVFHFLEPRSGRVLMDGSSSSAHDPVPHTPPLHHGLGVAHPSPSLRTEYPTSPTTPQSHASNALSVDFSSPSPNASAPLLKQSAMSSPDLGPPPPVPPKDFMPRRSSHPSRNHKSAGGR